MPIFLAPVVGFAFWSMPRGPFSLSWPSYCRVGGVISAIEWFCSWGGGDENSARGGGRKQYVLNKQTIQSTSILGVVL